MNGIYKITNPSGKVYIGQSWNIQKRKWYYKKGYCKGQPVIYKSILKYGSDAHEFKIIHELPDDCSQLVMDNYEQLYMDLYRNVGIKLLNAKEGGSRGIFSE